MNTNTKNILNLLLFFIIFILICLLQLLIFLFLVDSPFAVFNYTDIAFNVFGITALGLLFVKILQIVLLIKMSLFIIKKSDNPYLLKLFDNRKIPTQILLICILFDFNIFLHKETWGTLYFYNTLIGLSLNFFIIYLVSIFKQGEAVEGYLSSRK